MKVVKFQYPHSSFLSVQKDTSLIIDRMLKNERLLNLLYYTDNDPLDFAKHPAVTQDTAQSMLGQQIKLTPKVYVDDTVLQYIIITFDNFTPNDNNTEFRNNTIQFDIICHFKQWQLTDMQVRPYKIAAELDSMFNEARLSGIGTLKFLGATQTSISGKEYAGVTLLYAAMHGEDDKKYVDDIYLNRPENALLKEKLKQQLNEDELDDDGVPLPNHLGDDRFERPPADKNLEDNFAHIQELIQEEQNNK